ncbi:MAG: 2-hydroxyacyl-CoA dehydratase family protein [Desulfosoma sp.]
MWHGHVFQSHDSRTAPVVGWLCSATPEELLLAAGFLPQRLYGFEARGEESEAVLPTTFCAYVHGVLQAALTGAFRHMAAVVVVNSCDAMRRLADVWERHVKAPPVYRLDFPFATGPAAESYWVDVLRRLAAYLEGLSGRPMTEADLRHGVAILNETRRRVRALDAVRSLPKPRISGTDYAHWLVKAFVDDKKRFLAESAALCASEENREDESWDESGTPPRLVLGGCAADAPMLVRLVESCGTRVVADTLCTGTRHFDTLTSETGDPLRAVARRYLNRAPCARRVEAMGFVEHIRAVVRRTQADGVVFPTLKFCDMVRWRLPRLSAVMEQENIPFLHVERDGSAASWGQMETRVQAFVEMIHARGDPATGAGKETHAGR